MSKSIHLKIDPEGTAEKIRALKNEHNLTIEKFTEKIGVSEPSTVRRWLNGSNIPSSQNVLAITKQFNVGIDDVLSFTDENNE